MNAREILMTNPVVPVIALDSVEQGLELARALLAGGVRVLEITLRTPSGLAAIEAIAKQLPDAIVGAGTVVNAEQLKQVADAGAKFAISPGLNERFLKEAADVNLPLIPGIASPGELMLGMEYGLDTFKLFPASVVGGAAMLKALAGPFSNVKFCPTGGISPANAGEYLALSNVLCVGGSWLAPKNLLATKDYAAITKLAEESLTLRK